MYWGHKININMTVAPPGSNNRRLSKQNSKKMSEVPHFTDCHSHIKKLPKLFALGFLVIVMQFLIQDIYLPYLLFFTLLVRSFRKVRCVKLATDVRVSDDDQMYECSRGERSISGS